MVDSVVEFPLDDIKHLLRFNNDLIYEIKGQVESIHTGLGSMKAFLNDLKKEHGDSEYVRELVRQIRDVAHEAEDIINTFMINAATHKARSTLGKTFHGVEYTNKLRSVAKDIEAIKAKVKEIYDNKMFGIQTLYTQESLRKLSMTPRPKSVIEEDHVVGFHDEAKNIITQLIHPSKSLQVLSVVGMGGLGKTTLANRVSTHLLECQAHDILFQQLTSKDSTTWRSTLEEPQISQTGPHT